MTLPWEKIKSLLREKILLKTVHLYCQNQRIVIVTKDNQSYYPREFDEQLFKLFPYEYLEVGKFEDGIYRVYHLDYGSIESDFKNYIK